MLFFIFDNSLVAFLHVRARMQTIIYVAFSISICKSRKGQSMGTVVGDHEISEEMIDLKSHLSSNSGITISQDGQS